MDNEAIIAELLHRSKEPSRSTDHAGEFAQAVWAPVRSDDIARAEVLLGRELPPLLRAVYERVGNGGVGPGYGLLPLSAAAPEDDTVVALYAAFRSADPEDSAWSWPADLLPFCEWGCAIRSCVDCSLADCPVVTFDPGAREPGQPMLWALAQTHSSLRAWFTDWIRGVSLWEAMFEPDPERTRIGINPFTRAPLVVTAQKLRRS